MPINNVATAADTDDISDLLTAIKVQDHATAADAVQISDTRLVGTHHGVSDTDNISETIVAHVHRVAFLSDTVGIVAHLRDQFAHFSDAVGITDSLTVHGVFVQYDSWRPVHKPDATLLLICRTPENYHDTPAGLANMTFWTVEMDGTGEKPAIHSPATNGYGWTAYYHPEWSPDGMNIVMITETSDHYQLTIFNASGFGA